MTRYHDTLEGNRFFNLERTLAETLKPVSPDPIFIRSLKRKVTRGKDIILEHRRDYLGILMLGMGLAIGAIILLLGKRTK